MKNLAAWLPTLALALVVPAHASAESDDLAHTMAACGQPAASTQPVPRVPTAGVRLRTLRYGEDEVVFRNGNFAELRQGAQLTHDKARAAVLLPCLGQAFNVVAVAGPLTTRPAVSPISPNGIRAVLFGGTVLGLCLLATLGLIYLVPTIIALVRGASNLAGIALLNLFLGWTLLGWVGALVWSVASPTRKEAALRDMAYAKMAGGSTNPGAGPTV